MEFKFDENVIKQYLGQSILDTMLGEPFKRELESKMKEWMFGYNSPVGKMFQESLRGEFARMLALPENQKKLSEAAGKFLTQEYLDKITQHAIVRLKEDIERYRD